MAHKYSHVSTGGGFSVLNAGTVTEVIAQDGTIKGDIKEALAQGSIYIGNSSGVTSELSVKTDTGFMVGNGTTAVVKTMSGDVSMANTGAVTVSKINGVALGTTTATSGNLLIASGTSWGTVAMSGNATMTNAGVVTVTGAAGDFAVLGNTTIGNAGTNTFKVTAKLIDQLYCNDTGKAVQTLKIHNHANTSEIGGAEFKGEFVNTTGTVDGVANHWSYTPTGATGAPDAVRAQINNMSLDAGNTMTAGWLVGSQNSTIVNGTLNGAAICEFGTLGVLDGTGTRTLVSHSAGLASVLHVAAGDEPATGELSNIFCSSDYGGTVDNLIYAEDHATTTNFLNLTTAGNTGFVTTGGTDCTASGATDPSFTIKCIMPGGAAGYIRVWAAA